MLSSINRLFNSQIQPWPNPLKTNQLPSEIKIAVCENHARYPDLQLLADDDTVNITNDYCAKPSDLDASCSQMAGLKGPCTEYNRSQVALLCFKWIRDGVVKAFAQFTQPQPEAKRLSRPEFQALHDKYTALKLNLLQYGLKSNDTDDVIDALIVLGDMGKSETARARVKELLENEENVPADADDFKKYCVEQDVFDVFQVYRNLGPLQKELVKGCILREIHLGHGTHAENGKHPYEALEKNRAPHPIEINGEVLKIPPEILFDLAEFVHINDVAGAQGHKGNQGSLMYTTDVYRKINIVSKAARSLITDPNKTAADAYYDVLTEMCKYIGFDKILPITDQSPLQDKVTALLFQHRRALPKNLSSSNDLDSLYDLVGSLPQETLENLWDNFGVDAEIYNTYMPALLNAEPVKDLDGLKVCLDKILPCLAKKYHEIGFNETPPPLNVNKLIPKLGIIINSVQNDAQSLEKILKVNENGEAEFIEQEIPADAKMA